MRMKPKMMKMTKKMNMGGMPYSDGGMTKKMNMGGMTYSKGGKTGGSYRKAADGIASKGKTKGKQVKMMRGGMC